MKGEEHSRGDNESTRGDISGVEMIVDMALRKPKVSYRPTIFGVNKG